MKINVTTKNTDGSVAFNGTLNRAEVTTLLQYAVNNLVAMGYIFGQEEQDDYEEGPSRITPPSGRNIQ